MKRIAAIGCGLLVLAAIAATAYALSVTDKILRDAQS